jgi:hypothetical protein|uniref:Uncharacterized protein n=1 Tax=Zea mays TaxID=4577 RepID=A0A804NAI0_MAIZE
MKIRSHGKSNLGPEECYSDHLTKSARGPFAKMKAIKCQHSQNDYLITNKSGLTWENTGIHEENHLDLFLCGNFPTSICLTSFSLNVLTQLDKFSGYALSATKYISKVCSISYVPYKDFYSHLKDIMMF